MSRDYKDTLQLPKTDFPMKAGLPAKEEALLARWQAQDLWGRLRAQSAGREVFVLHDGPPYANGHLHIGHALNKILKDIVNRCQQMIGKDAPYTLGWDCHGLPIEWKIEEEYRAAGRDKDSVPILEFRRQCRSFAARWLDIQRDEFQRLGVMADWRAPYDTMAFAAEARIAAEVGRFLLSGALVRGVRPVLWSPVEKTALAEAEVEYRERAAHAIWVRFPVLQSAAPQTEGAALVIWTTTPWTIPGNRAVAYGPDIDYEVLAVRSVAPGALAHPGERLIVAAARREALRQAAGILDSAVLSSFPGRALEETRCRHPLRGRGYDAEVPALPAEFGYMIVTGRTG